MLRFCLVGLLWVAVGGAGAAELRFDFATQPTNVPPAGFTNVLAGNGRPGDWRLLQIPQADTTTEAVLAQVSMDVADERFPLLIYQGRRFDDFTFTTRFQLVEGVVEQMAGIVFRYQDPNNFYVIRASGLGQNLRFYKVVGGVRSNPIGPTIPFRRGVWYELEITCQGNKIRARINGRDALPELKDTSFASGRIGFWTKSDSVSYFTDARINYTPREAPAVGLVRDALRRYPRLLGLKIYVADDQGVPVIAASNDPAEVGAAGGDSERGALARGQVYYGRTRNEVSVVQPLRDHNGEPIAAVRVVLKPFPGQTEQTLLARAQPIVKEMQVRVRTLGELRGD